MSLQRRRFTKEFKLQVVREVAAGKTLAQAAREHNLHVSTIIDWRRSLDQYGDRAFAGNSNAYTDDAHIAELERKIGQLTMENDLLKKVLSRLEVRPPRNGGNGSSK